jgi:hypothetical protein
MIQDGFGDPVDIFDSGEIFGYSLNAIISGMWYCIFGL